MSIYDPGIFGTAREARSYPRSNACGWHWAPPDGQQETNPRYWGLIREFGNLTGVPLVLNTSFNDNEPIVCRPEEAIECFLRTKMDVLVLGGMLVRKPASIENDSNLLCRFHRSLSRQGSWHTNLDLDRRKLGASSQLSFPFLTDRERQSMRNCWS